jgi:hypothetical protein
MHEHSYSLPSGEGFYYSNVPPRRHSDSWVPKFTCRVDVVPLTLGIFDSQNSLDLFTAGGTISRALITWHNELLGVRGYTIDHIEKMYSVDGVWNMLSEDTPSSIPEFFQKHVGESVTEVLWRTVLADQ